MHSIVITNLSIEVCKKREELPQYESDTCINHFKYRLLKFIEVAGKHILNIFSQFAVERNV